MNFYTIRYAILAIIMIITISIFLKIFKKQITNKMVIAIIIIFVIMYQIVFSIIPEENFLTFPSVEDAMKYSFPRKKIIHKIEGKRCIFVIYGEEINNTSYTHFIKNDERVEFKKLENRQTTFFIFNEYLGVIEKSGEGETLITIGFTTFKDVENNTIIEDTIQSRFNNIVDSDKQIDTYLYYTILEEDKILDDYYLVINEHLVDIKPYLK